MSEEETRKPTVVNLKVTIPTQESIIAGLRQMFPMIEVEVEEEKPGEEPSEPQG